MRYRVWMDHPESSCHCWASPIVHSDLDEANKEKESFQDTSNGEVEFEVLDVKTGYPYYLKEDDAIKMGYPKRVM